MSATPRPWVVDDSGSVNVLTIVHQYLGGTAEVAQLYTDEDEPTPQMRADADLIVRAVNAFDALLAVAKAAEWRTHEEGGPRDCSICFHVEPSHDDDCSFARLLGEHPGWREWSA